jgi:hypothetical protein
LSVTARNRFIMDHRAAVCTLCTHHPQAAITTAPNVQQWPCLAEGRDIGALRQIDNLV